MSMLIFFKQKTAYEIRISDWSSDVCSSDLGWTISGGDSTTITLPRRAINRERTGIEVARHVAQHHLHGLQITHRLAEQRAGRDARQRLLQRASGQPDRRRTDRRAKDVEHPHRHLDTLALLPAPRLGGDTAISKGHSGGPLPGGGSHRGPEKHDHGRGH